ncbi:MAG TPA: DMT family transporter, partial [Burkholderiaceae bacterium]|nr:DMT family transporter [Burkholderiaceae bacterium]
SAASVAIAARTLFAVASAAVGYVAGAQLAAQMRAEQVICWVLVLALPLTLPVTLAAWPAQAARASAWGGFGYVTLFSMWLGFFAWYRGLALGGTVRVSQVQLVQPFLALLAAVPLLGERLDATTVGFSLAVIATVFLGRRMPVHPGRTHP